MENKASFGIFSGSDMKLVACVLMAIDHIGLILFPDIILFRIIGRLAFPLFAYFIAEGCRYTKSRLRHFLTVFAMGAVYLLFYLIYAGVLYGSIFLTFSVSILFIYLLDFLKGYVIKSPTLPRVGLSVLLFSASLAAAYALFSLVSFDYGFFGMLCPVMAGLFDPPRGTEVRLPSALSSRAARIILLGICLIPICIQNKQGTFPLLGLTVPTQYVCLLALPLLFLYNGKAGNKRLKYFFYIFYPVHLGLIEAVALIIDLLQK